MKDSKSRSIGDVPTAPALSTASRIRAVLNRNTVVVACLVALVPFAWLTYRFNWIMDDAFISFRYAKHLAEGHGLRFNVGDMPPTEGYSNFLWVLVLAPFELIGRVSPVVSRVISVPCGVVLLWRIARFVKTRLNCSLIPLMFSVLFFATFPPVAVWSTSGLAAIPYALLIFLTFEFVLGGRQAPRGLAGGTMCALLILIRADGVIWVAAMIALAALNALVKRDKAGFEAIGVCAGLAAMTLFALTVFRLVYFGHPLPNTVYAKVGLSAVSLIRGLRYVGRLLLAFPHLVLILAAASAVVVRDRRALTVGHQVALMAACALVHPILVGGDWMPMWRFLVPATPFVAILLAMLIQRMVVRPPVAVGCGIGVIVLSLLPAYNVHVVPPALREKLRASGKAQYNEYERWSRQHGLAEELTVLGRALGKHTKPGESLIAGSIGAVSYYSELFIYDTVGLVNAEVAHRRPRRGARPGWFSKRVNPTFFLKYRPTYYWANLTDLLKSGKRNLKPGSRIPIGSTSTRIPGIYPVEAQAMYERIGIPLAPTDGSSPTKLVVLYVQRGGPYALPRHERAPGQKPSRSDVRNDPAIP